MTGWAQSLIYATQITGESTFFWIWALMNIIIFLMCVKNRIKRFAFIVVTTMGVYMLWSIATAAKIHYGVIDPMTYLVL